jgi:hypothetical protein
MKFPTSQEALTVQQQTRRNILSQQNSDSNLLIGLSKDLLY